MSADQPGIQVLIADAQWLFSEVLAGALSDYPDISVLNEHPVTASEAVSIIEKRRPNVLLLDQWLPGGDDPSITRWLTEWVPKGQVIVLSWLYGPEHISRALMLGAAAFLPKSVDVPVVVETIHLAWERKLPVHADALEKMIEAIRLKDDAGATMFAQLARLTPREMQVVRHLSTGRPLVELSGRLGITPGTVKAHIRKILVKTEAQSQKEVIAMARYCGLIS